MVAPLEYIGGQYTPIFLWVSAGAGTWRLISPVLGAENESMAKTPLFSRLPILPVAAVVALALLSVTLLAVHPVSAQGGATPCASGDAVDDAANNPDLLADCDALLAARVVMGGSEALNWSVAVPIANWHGVSLGALRFGLPGWFFTCRS